MEYFFLKSRKLDLAECAFRDLTAFTLSAAVAGRGITMMTSLTHNQFI